MLARGFLFFSPKRKVWPNPGDARPFSEPTLLPRSFALVSWKGRKEKPLRVCSFLSFSCFLPPRRAHAAQVRGPTPQLPTDSISAAEKEKRPPAQGHDALPSSFPSTPSPPGGLGELASPRPAARAAVGSRGKADPSPRWTRRGSPPACPVQSPRAPPQTHICQRTQTKTPATARWVRGQWRADCIVPPAASQHSQRACPKLGLLPGRAQAPPSSPVPPRAIHCHTTNFVAPAIPARGSKNLPEACISEFQSTGF